jgi:hypothetical protein
MIYAKGLGTLIDGDKGVDILIAHVQTRYPEWQEMGDTAAPPVMTHLSVPSDAKEERNGKWRLSNGNYLEKTAYFYVVVLGDEPRPAVITMRSSNLTPARELNQLIKNLRFKDEKGVYNPAAYAAVYNLKTVGKVAGSKSWHVYKPSMSRALDVSVESDAQLYLMAQELQKHKNFKSLCLKVQQNLSMKRRVLNQLKRLSNSLSEYSRGRRLRESDVASLLIIT